MTKNLVILSDLHVNSTVGLSMPVIKLDDGGEYHASKSQRWLYDNWCSFWNYVDALDGETVTVLNGDIVDISKHATQQMVTKNIPTVIDNAQSLLLDAQRISTSIYMVRGTTAHTGDSAEIEELLAERLGCIQNPEGRYSWWHLALDVQGVLFDIAHHGKVGTTTWNRTAPLHTLAASITFEALRNNMRLPDVVVRSHKHLHADTHDNLPVRVISTPAWQLITEYVHKLGIVELADIGGLVFRCDSGVYELDKLLYRPQAKQPIYI